MELFAGRFSLIRLLGRGGMGDVHLARDLQSGETVALKRLGEPLQHASAEALREEYAMLARVRHPVIVRVLGFDRAADGTPYLSMEYVPGVPSDQAALAGDWPALVWVAAELTRGLEALHAGGVVHGDLKPSNVLVLRDPQADGAPFAVRLLDLGLAGLLARERPGHTGTPGFQAPEVVLGKSPTPRSDLHGLGATLFTLALGEPPFPGEDVPGILARQQAGPPSALPLERAGAPAALTELILRLLATAPDERPVSATEVRRELEAMHPAARRPLAERLETTMLAGREPELARFDAMVAGAPGTRRVMVVAGERGRGKSTLLEAFATRAMLAGRAVVRRAGSAGDLPGEALRALTRRLEADAGGLDAEPADGSSDELERWSSRAERAITRLAGRRGEPLLILDDADQLDEPSLAGLRRLWLREPAPPARWVIACGAAALDGASAERLLADAGVASILEPGPLSRETIAEVAAIRLGAEAPRPLVDRLVEGSGGHPGMVVALLREAARQGAVGEHDGALTVDVAALEALAPPSDYLAAESARITALPDPAREVVLTLAMADRPLEAEAISRLTGADASAVLPGLAATGLVVAEADGGWSCATRWAARRLLDAEPAETLRGRHRRMLEIDTLSWGERFEHLRGAGERSAALAAAEQAFGELPEARLAAAAAALAIEDAATRATWHERAARELALNSRYVDAMPHWLAAYECEPERQPEAGRRAAGYCVAAIRGGFPARTIAMAERAIPTAAPVFAARLMVSLSGGTLYLNRLDESLEQARAALRLAEQAGDPEAEHLATHNIALKLLLKGGHEEEIEALAQRSAAAARRMGGVDGEMRGWLALGSIHRALSQTDSAEAEFEQGIELGRRHGHRAIFRDLLTEYGILLTESGRWSESLEVTQEGFRMLVADANGAQAARFAHMVAVANALAGRPRAALRSARDAIRLARRHLPLLVAGGWRVLGMAHRISGRFAAAARALRRSERLASDAGMDRLWREIDHALIATRRHRWADAEAALARAVGAESSIRDNGVAVAHARWALVEVARGDLAAARARITRVEEWTSAHPRLYARVMLSEARAALWLAEGRERDGAAEARRTLDEYAAMPSPPDRAMAALGFARLALDRGLAEAPGMEWLRLAARTFERLGDAVGRAEALEYQLLWLERFQPPAREPADQGDLLRRVSDLLRSYADPRALTHRAMQLVVDQLHAERGVLLWADPVTRVLSPVAEYGAIDAETRQEAIGYSRKVTAQVAESGGSIVVPDVGSDRRILSDSVRSMKLRSLVCVPMFLAGKVAGAVYLDDSRRSNAFGQDERRLLEGFANLMAVAIESSRGHEQVERRRSQLERENRDLLAQATQRMRHSGLIGTSPEMQTVVENVEAAARNPNTTVLVTGESGTGKELAARTVHELSRRRDKRFVTVNCGAIAPGLLESELFGHVRYAFTGAMRDRQGAFELANGGTLFLDEVAEMPLPQQVALLTVLGSREVVPVGAERAVPVDVRVIAATNADLDERVREGRFREELLFRLRVLDIRMPPLRDRKADIPALAQGFLEQFCARDKRPVPRMMPQFTAVLMQSDWPGNVRELQNYVERVLARTEGNVMFPDPLPLDLQKTGAIPFIGPRRLPDAIAEFERRILRETLDRHDGNQTAAARDLGISEQTLRYKLRALGLPSARQNQRIRRNRRNG